METTGDLATAAEAKTPGQVVSHYLKEEKSRKGEEDSVSESARWKKGLPGNLKLHTSATKEGLWDPLNQKPTPANWESRRINQSFLF